MVYITYDFKTPKCDNGSFGKMYSNLHCLTISGYNSETNYVIQTLVANVHHHGFLYQHLKKVTIIKNLQLLLDRRK